MPILQLDRVKPRIIEKNPNKIMLLFWTPCSLQMIPVQYYHRNPQTNVSVVWLFG